jgi:hypothetical protein
MYRMVGRISRRMNYIWPDPMPLIMAFKHQPRYWNVRRQVFPIIAQYRYPEFGCAFRRLAWSDFVLSLPKVKHVLLLVMDASLGKMRGV